MNCCARWKVSLYQNGQYVDMHRDITLPGPPVKGQVVHFAAGDVEIGTVSMEETDSFVAYVISTSVVLLPGEEKIAKAVTEWQNKGFSITSNECVAYRQFGSSLYHLRVAQAMLRKVMPSVPGLEENCKSICFLAAIDREVSDALEVLGELDDTKSKLNELMSSGDGGAEKMSDLGKKVNELMLRIFK